MKDIRELFGIEYPIVQGAMAQIAYYPLVSAVSNAGGLGIIASGGLTKEQLRTQILEVRKRTDKPFGVNLMLMEKNIDEIVDVVIEENVKVVTTGAGNPKPYVERLKSAGVKVVPVVPSLKIALKMQEIGVDAVIVEGTEAGGHVGEVTSIVLWPIVSSVLSIPVIAAGGISDGKSLMAAFALGAKGVQIGTAFLATEECPVSAEYKQAVIEGNELGTVVTGRKNKAPVRTIANKMTAEYLVLEERNATRDELEHLTMGALKKAVYEGNVEEGSVMAGQVIGRITEIKTVKELIEGIVKEAKEVDLSSVWE